MDDLNTPPIIPTELKKHLSNKGGRYKGVSDRESVIFSVYTNVTLGAISADRRGISLSINFDTPPGKAREKKKADRERYWKTMGGKRLTQGGLIVLVWERKSVYLGVITSRTDDLVKSSAESENRLSIKVSFFQAPLEILALRQLPSSQKLAKITTSPNILVEAPGMYEAVRPFLEALRIEATSVPLSKYLIQNPDNALSNVQIDPPEYTTSPGFSWDLSSLFPGRESVRMVTTDPSSIRWAQFELQRRSRLDVSQADAVISCLTRELALIQGPPGTGKVLLIEILEQILILL